MLTKDKLKKAIDTLPDAFTIEDVFEKIILIYKIEQGMRDVEEGNVLTNEQVREKLGKWLK